MWKSLIAIALATASAHADPTYLHAEIDPLTLATEGYGGQIGLRIPALHGVRLAVASFSLHEPDAIAQINGNDGFHLRVRPSAALYALYYFKPPGHDGFAIGASVRYLRVRYELDAAPGEQTTVSEVSPEAIIGYQWHPFHNELYLQPWLALGVVLSRDKSPTVGGRTYDELPISPFFTVNIGWEQAL